jgi:putative hydrolase of the HAD superfamily
MSGVILWDFHGTLARRSWSMAMLEVLQADEGHPQDVSREDLSLAIRSGFPWHEPQRPHPELHEPERWWQAMTRHLAGGFESLGADAGRALDLASRVRARYVDPATYEVFEDTQPVLNALHERGWRHWILSNHVPELPGIVAALGWDALVEGVLTSARLGYEKPHPEIFALARARAGRPDTLWMVGDNVEADVLGAERAGIPAILVRSHDERAGRRCADLHGVARFLDRA